MSGSLLTGPVPSFKKTIVGYRTADILVGDTMERVAVRELGDASLWYDLVALNGLRPPYIVDDPALVGPGIKLSGQDLMLIPSSAPPATGVAAAPDVFGIDVLLGSNGQIVISDAGDYATIAGPDNLAQALRLRLASRPGDLVYHPEYGCLAYRLLGRSSGDQSQLAAAFVAAAAGADPRVVRTQRAVATTMGDVLAASVEAVAANGKRVPVSIGRA